MWTLENVKTTLVSFLDQELTPNTWMVNFECSRETATEIFIWSKISQWEKQISKRRNFWLWIFFCTRVRMSCNIGDNRNIFHELKTKLGPYRVVLTTPKVPPEKKWITVVDMQQIPNIEKVDSRKDISCLSWTKYNGRRKFCVNFVTDIDNLNFVVYGYRNHLYLRDIQTDLNLTNYESILVYRVHLWSFFDWFFERCIELDETTVHFWNKLHQEWTLSI